MHCGTCVFKPRSEIQSYDWTCVEPSKLSLHPKEGIDLHGRVRELQAHIIRMEEDEPEGSPTSKIPTRLRR